VGCRELDVRPVLFLYYGEGARRVMTTISGGALNRTGSAVVPIPLVT
jgi:hypothetical protein